MIWTHFTGQFSNVSNETRVSFCFYSEEVRSKNVEVLGALGRLEASLELTLSSTMCSACEFFGLDSDDDVCLSGLALWMERLEKTSDSSWSEVARTRKRDKLEGEKRNLQGKKRQSSHGNVDRREGF